MFSEFNEIHSLPLAGPVISISVSEVVCKGTILEIYLKKTEKAGQLLLSPQFNRLTSSFDSCY